MNKLKYTLLASLFALPTVTHGGYVQIYSDIYLNGNESEPWKIMNKAYNISTPYGSFDNSYTYNGNTTNKAAISAYYGTSTFQGKNLNFSAYTPRGYGAVESYQWWSLVTGSNPIYKSPIELTLNATDSINIQNTNGIGLYAYAVDARELPLSPDNYRSTINVFTRDLWIEAYEGIHTQANSEPNSDQISDWDDYKSRAKVNIVAVNTTIIGSYSAITAHSNSEVNISGHLTAKAPNIIDTRGYSIINLNKNDNEGKNQLKLEGNIAFETPIYSSGYHLNSEVWIKLTNENSEWEGNIYKRYPIYSHTVSTEGFNPDDQLSEEQKKVTGINIVLQNEAVWRPTILDLSDKENIYGDKKYYLISEDQPINHLYFNRGIIDYSHLADQPYLKVRVENLYAYDSTNPNSTADNRAPGTLVMRVDFVPGGSSSHMPGFNSQTPDNIHNDQFVILNSGEGKNLINVVPQHLDELTDGKTPIERSGFLVRDYSSGSQWELNTTTGNTIDIGNLLYVYSLQSEAGEPRTDENGQVITPTDWFIVTTAPNEPILSPTAEAVLAMAGMGAEQMTYLAGLTDLRKRLGEVRLDVQDGLWVQVAGDKSRLDGFSDTRFKQTQYRLNIGLDYKNEHDWLIGANFKYSNSNQKTYDTLYRAKGDAHSYGANLYATWFNLKGCYLDLVATFDKYHNRISTHTLTGESVRGSYRNFGWGLSAETGHKFLYGEEKDYFLEPQLQLSFYHVKGARFTTTNGMTVKQNNFHSLTGRLGIVAGKDWHSDDMEKKTQLYGKAGLKHGFSGTQKIRVNDINFESHFKGTRVYYGLGGDWQAKKNLKFYAQLEREHGKNYRKEIEGSIGLKYQF